MLKFRVVYTPRALTESVHWVHGHGIRPRNLRDVSNQCVCGRAVASINNPSA
jgi:hypothetical protein